MHLRPTAHLQRRWLTDVGARRANDTYGSALKAHPGKSQGRPSTNSRSKRIEQHRPAQPAFAPGCPATRTVAPYSPTPKRSTAATNQSQGAETSNAFHTGYQRDRSI